MSMKKGCFIFSVNIYFFRSNNSIFVDTFRGENRLIIIIKTIDLKNFWIFFFINDHTGVLITLFYSSYLRLLYR